jgi:hypothetical protein
MSDAGLQTQGGLEIQPIMPVRRLNNFVYCPRLFYFQWVENIFQESVDTVAGSLTHRNVDAPSKFDDEKQKALAENLPEGAKLRSLRLESEAPAPPRLQSSEGGFSLCASAVVAQS